MKLFLKCLKGLAILLILMIVSVFLLRAYNHFSYSKYQQAEDNSIYSDPQNLDLYPTDLDGVDVKHIEGNYLNGFHLKPNNKTEKGVIVTFGGSEGSPAYYEAVSFAKGGYEVLSLFSFGMPNQKARLSKIPLDFFDEVLDYIHQNIAESTPLTLYGGSKGAELILNLVNYYPEIDHLILMAPSAYTFNGLDYDNLASSWTYKGEELPYISTMQAGFTDYIGFLIGMVTGAPTSYEALYRTAIENTSDAETKKILRKAVDVDMLIFAGGQDRMWPSALMAETIKETQGERAEVHIYDEAGHIFAGDGYMASDYGIIAVGGDEKTNAAAGESYRQIIKERLDQWHQ